MRVALVTHPSSLEHRGPPMHPERPDRVGAAIAGVEASGLTVIPRLAAPVESEALLRVHDQAFIDALERFCAKGGGSIDLDTYAGPGSWEAALHSAGAGATALAALDGDDSDVAFIATRPPGHHAERARAMGFCLFNNVAVAAAELAARGDRVAIVDWDVHHGNGTQELFAAVPEILYVSLHQHPFYPGSGDVGDVGFGDAAGTVVNLPLPAGSGKAVYEDGFRRVVLPVVRQFEPDWLLVSAGYDAHVRDPLAGMALEDEDYSMMSGALATAVPARRSIFFLEGGYDLDAVTKSVAATLNGHAAGTPLLAASGRIEPDPTIGQIVETLAPYWDLG